MSNKFRIVHVLPQGNMSVTSKASFTPLSALQRWPVCARLKTVYTLYKGLEM